MAGRFGGPRHDCIEFGQWLADLAALDMNASSDVDFDMHYFQSFFTTCHPIKRAGVDFDMHSPVPYMSSKAAKRHRSGALAMDGGVV